ncbi:sulfite exporter TauE/SafE family protein [Mycobacterium sp. ACS4331]|uniref:sulfite exporter TauE/SafE family protein n=1 Tax=Mycobacterium sp. ACS4331 TaxID=1834121 RepID=UPI0007FC446A|nr:sulfite exporter TauE/SafE family protein [Mycobacterium sp. ACS4331]OBF27418.1 hypothetical protein A5727_26135 [Mycobacterium sp. ACS4331]
MFALTLILAVFIGITLGLLGGGGSILTVPLLAYVAGMEPKEAIATSLLVVGVTSAVGAISHARAGRVRWRTGLIFGLAGMVGAYGGGVLSTFIPGTVLLIAFAVVMVATAIPMLRGRREVQAGAAARRLPVLKVIAQGLAVGLVTGMIGAGGGFLVVPALALLGGLPMPVAVGTSLIVIAMNSFAGLAGHLFSVAVDWPVALGVTAAAVAGALVGARLTALISPDVLRRAFGWFVLVMASVILAQEIHPVVGAVAGGATALAAVMAWTCARRGLCPLRWLSHVWPGPNAPA